MHAQQQLDITRMNCDACDWQQSMCWQVYQLALGIAFLQNVTVLHLAFPGSPEASACTPGMDINNNYCYNWLSACWYLAFILI